MGRYKYILFNGVYFVSLSLSLSPSLSLTSRRYEWYRKPNWFVVSINQWVVVTLHAYPFASFTDVGIKKFAWSTLVFILLMHLWQAIWARCTGR